MNENGHKLLKLMFRENETVCVSHNKYGYHSVPLENTFDGEVNLISPSYPAIPIDRVRSRDLMLLALNPIKGWRQDANCTAYRNFLIDLDYGPIDEQLDYIKKIGIPYSAIIFSGNRGLHVLISLDKDLPSESIYRTLGEWILNVATAADQNCKNPSRCIRVAGAVRDNGNEQKLVEFHGAVKLSDLSSWLLKFPDAKPRKWEATEPSEIPDPYLLPSWIRKQLRDGFDFKNGRNKTWFSIACAFAKAGFSMEDTMTYLDGHFIPERDFTRREWESAIKSAFKYIFRA